MSGKKENAGRPSKDRLDPRDVSFIKAKIKDSKYASQAVFYEHAYAEAKSPKYRDYQQPSDVLTVTEAYKNAFSGRRPLPKLYLKVMEELLSITSDSFPSQIESVKKQPFNCESQPPDFTTEQLKNGDRVAWNTAYKCFYNLASITLQPCLKLLSPEKLKTIATKAVDKVIVECVDQATSVEELKSSVCQISKKELLQMLRKEGIANSLNPSCEQAASQQLVADLHRDLERREREIRLTETLKRFSAQCREVVFDYFNFHLTEEEIVKKRNLAIETVRDWISQSRSEFRHIYRI